MLGSWAQELWRITLLVAAAFLIGALAGHITAFLFLALFAYLAWHLINLYRLERWLRESKKLQPPEAGGIWGGVFNHIYRLQQRNRKRKRKLAAMLNRFQESTAALPDGTVVLSPAGEIEWYNDAAHRLLGLRSPQDVGQRIDNLVRHPAFTDFFVKGDYSTAVEFPSPSDPEVRVSVLVVPYGKDQRLLIARDVTRLQRLEQIRRDFVANVSHELRTPLTVLRGFLETLRDGAGTDPREWQRSLQLMEQQATRMQRIVNDLLLLSRLETEKEEPPRKRVAMPELLAAIVNEARVVSGERAHAITLEAEPGLYLNADEDGLRSAFSNLVLNAVQYTPDRGRITIRWYADEAGAHLEVADTGVGIAAHHIPRLTERFYRVDVARSRQSGGTGLGLAIVKHVLNRHQARLRVASELGKGSTFICDFPAELILRKTA